MSIVPSASTSFPDPILSKVKLKRDRNLAHDTHGNYTMVAASKKIHIKNDQELCKFDMQTPPTTGKTNAVTWTSLPGH